jgi:excisionase family DNA binding protein
MMDLTVKEFAAQERVDERTVRRWILKGAVEYRRTPGGGIRIRSQQSGAVFIDMTNQDSDRQSST